MNPLKAIRGKCLDCCCGQINEVKLCPSSNCPLHPFRFGKNPFRKAREYSPEQLDALKARLSKKRPTNSAQKISSSSNEGDYATEKAGESLC